MGCSSKKPLRSFNWILLPASCQGHNWCSWNCSSVAVLPILLGGKSPRHHAGEERGQHSGSADSQQCWAFLSTPSSILLQNGVFVDTGGREAMQGVGICGPGSRMRICQTCHCSSRLCVSFWAQMEVPIIAYKSLRGQNPEKVLHLGPNSTVSMLALVVQLYHWHQVWQKCGKALWCRYYKYTASTEAFTSQHWASVLGR